MVNETEDPGPHGVAGESAELDARTSTRSSGLRWVALDALAPGLGHILAGRRRLGLLFGVPSSLAFIAVLLALATVPFAVLAADALNAFAVLLAIQGVVLAWRLLAVLAGVRATWRPDWTRLQRFGAISLIALVIGPQAYLGYVTNVAREEVDRVFSGPSGGAWVPPAAKGPRPSRFPSAGPPTASPTPSPTPEIPRLNVLLIGIDAGVGRNTAATDTMIVASLDSVTETVSMVSVPRDMVDVPLPDGSFYGPKLNSLDSDARHHPARFPGSDGTGHDVLMAAIGTLLDMKIDYYATVNLGGFVRVIDVLGGVDVSVSRSLCDPRYDEYGFTHGFSITRGLHHLDGQQALAYARIRLSAGESDFTRAARQQEVISGIRDAVVKRGFVSDPVALLQAVGRSLETNVPRDMLPQLAGIMSRVDRTRTYRTVIKSPLVKAGFDARGSIQIPDVAGIRALAASLFPPTGTAIDPALLAPPPATSGSGSGVRGCAPIPAATPSPTVAPSPTASPSPMATKSPSPTVAPSTKPTKPPKAPAATSPTR